MTITRLLVANRGEIARRVFRTCRDLGIATVAVHSDADAGLAFVAEADAAVRLPGNTPAETYLRGDLVVEAALAAGADAVHPGYGFLSEQADFARRVLAAGLTWIGPAPASIEAMGSKVEAKRLMEKAGVPVLGDLDPATVAEADLPLLVKASAGGGGRGMRVVRTLDEVPAAVAQASAEAASAFGDPTVFCEPYVERGRHVEVQVLGDPAGEVLVLGARDCSIQRRHQKIVEEAPPPGVPEATLTAMYDAARAAAEAVDYVGAGTVEFLLDPATGRFFFLEMNTRLQVEHPVTECVYGVDLVALQIAAAEGSPLTGFVSGASRSSRGGTADESGWGLRPSGHAVEVRLYAEDPAAGWQPQSGRLTRFEIPRAPEVATELDRPVAHGIRVDSGFRAGDEVGTHYDAMLAKVVAWAPTRPAALRRLASVLERSRIHGVRTNRDLLVNLLRHEAVLAGDVSTDFLDRHDLAGLAAPRADARAVRLSAFAATVALAERSAARRTVQHRVPVAWRNVVSAPQRTRFVRVGGAGADATADATADAAVDAALDDGVVEILWYGGRDGYLLDDPSQEVTVLAAGEHRVVLEVDGLRRTFEVFTGAADAAGGVPVDVESEAGHVALRRTPRFTDPAAAVATGSLLAPMPGSVVGVAVAAGEAVAAGQAVLVLEAMKMQHTVHAPHDGVVAELPVAVGDQVAAGAVLAVVTPADPEAPETAVDSAHLADSADAAVPPPASEGDQP